MDLLATVVSAVFHGVMGGYALLATLVAGACLLTALVAVVRDVSTELIAEATFGTGPTPPR